MCIYTYIFDYLLMYFGFQLDLMNFYNDIYLLLSEFIMSGLSKVLLYICTL